MVAKPQIDSTQRGRAGVPLARAQRLQERAAAQGERRVGGLLPFTVAGAGLLGAVVYLSVGAGSAPSPQTAAVLTQAAPASATSAPPVEAIETVSAANDIASSEPTVALPARPRLAPCLETIEVTLTRLEEANSKGWAWGVKQAYIQDVAQAGLNCHLATVQINGDVDLAKSDLADLRVSWDRGTLALELSVVDSVDPAVAKVVYTDDGQPTEFIVH